MSGRKTYFLITGNKIIDGIILIIVSMVLFGGLILIVEHFGSPVFWWQKFGGMLASILFGFHIVHIIAIFSFFIVGIKFFISGIFERLLIPEKVWIYLLVYIPALICITYLTAIQILPPSLFEAIFYKLLYAILGAGIGYYIAKAGV